MKEVVRNREDDELIWLCAYVYTPPCFFLFHFQVMTYPIVVMKLDVNESSANLKRRQLFPTPAVVGVIGVCESRGREMLTGDKV